MTLRTRLSVAFAFVVLVPVLVSAALVGAVLPQRLDDQVRGRVHGGATGAAVVLAEVCARAHVAAEALARRALAIGPRAAVVAGSGAHDDAWAALLDGQGRAVAASGSAPAGAATAPDCTGVTSSPGDALVGRAVVTGHTPVRAAVVAIPVRDVLRSLEAVAGGGEVLVRSGDRVVATTHPSGRLPHAVREAVPPVAGRPFTVVVAIPEPAYGALRLLLGLLVVAVLVTAWLLARRLAAAATRPLTGLSDAAERVAAGDLDTVVPSAYDDEVGRVAGAFNVMTASLREHLVDLERSRDELRRTVQLLGETLSSTHDLDRILSVVLDTAMATSGAPGGAVLIDDDGRLVPRVVHGDESGREGVRIRLAAHGTARGVLELTGKADGTPFSDAELSSVRGLAAHAAVAIENVLLHQEAQRMSVTDGLTGLWNRRFLMQTLRHEVERAARYQRPLTVVIIDIDKFKLINDEYGHQRGDAVLSEVAERLRGEVRESDTLARYGGEEFVLVLPEADTPGAIRACQRVCAVIRERPFDAGGGEPLRVTVSVGAAIFPTDAGSGDDLLRAADEALYAAKRTGRDGWWLAEAVPPQEIRLTELAQTPRKP